jgi:hypothetical protein
MPFHISHSFILQLIWPHSLALVLHILPVCDSQLLDIIFIEETYLEEKHIWCNKSGAIIWPFFERDVVWCVSCWSLGRSWHAGLGHSLCHLRDMEIGLTAVVACRRGMFAPLGRLVPPLVYLKFHVCPIL